MFTLPIEKLLHTLRISCLVSRVGCSEWQFLGDMPPLFPLTAALGDTPCALVALRLVRPKSFSLTNHGLE